MSRVVFVKVIIRFVVALILGSLFHSCDSTDPKPPDTKPIGYQEDIPWPSLADSPWPMGHHDPQSTGRVNFMCSAGGILIDSINIDFDKSTSLIVASDTSFAVTNFGYIKLYNFSGVTLWEKQLDETATTPVIDRFGNIYFISLSRGLISLDIDGKINWERNDIYLPYLARLIIDLSGNILLVNDNSQLMAISMDGKDVWSFNDQRIERGTHISISPDGKLLYLTGSDPSLIAIDYDNRQIAWEFGQKSEYSGVAPLVDSYGNVYLSTYDSTYSKVALYSLNSVGKINWYYEHFQYFVQSSGYYKFSSEPTIDKYGNIFFGYDTLVSINYDGSLKWKLKLEGFISSLICDGNNNIFAATEYNQNISVFSISNTGNTMWSVSNLAGSVPLGKSSAITENNFIIPSFGKNIYIIK
jgi:hypothetical protein